MPSPKYAPDPSINLRTLAPAICAAVALCACAPGTVRIPAHDATSPIAFLDVVGSGGILVLADGDDPGSARLAGRDSLILIAIGEDADGGVKDLSLVGNAIVTCRESATGRLRSRSAGFARRSLGSALANPRAPIRKSSRFILRAGDFQEMCPNEALAAVVGQATARTVNFHGGSSASSRLEFRLDAPGPADTSASDATIPSLEAAPTGATPVSGSLGPRRKRVRSIRRSVQVSPQASPKSQIFPEIPESRENRV
jgi:hypothetical protein